MTIVIGLGGGTCSGKTILAKHLVQILGGPVLHQDDYAPPPDKLPYHPVHKDLQDWDDPPTAILWPKFVDAIQNARAGKYPDLETREAKEVAVRVDDQVFEQWKGRLGRWKDRVDWVVVDGFLMFWDQAVTAELDVRVFLRVPKQLLQARREGRSYLLEDGNTWIDPPGYFDKIVWPAYLKAHKHIPGAIDSFVKAEADDQPKLTSAVIDRPSGKASIDAGEVSEESDPRARGVVIVDVGDGAEEMTRAFEKTCEEVERYLIARFGGGDAE